MRDLRGKTAVITGAASGLGLALAHRCASEGMRLVLADVAADPLQAAAAALRPTSELIAVVVDVRHREELDRLAAAAYERFGAVHLLVNNAGVATTRPIWETTTADWHWVLSVNLWGVIHGVGAFVPRMLAQADPSHIVNTASVAGFLSEPGMAAYSVSKHGVVALSETLSRELTEAGDHIGVSVLCPAWVPTGIDSAERNRPADLQESTPLSAAAQQYQAGLQKAVSAGRVSAETIAAMTLAAVRARQLYIFPHPKIRPAIAARMQRILDALQ
jgi:NAD(P)-dependent dehydrogenase (short-subunit alcohol dehydrogenase family)